MFRNPTSVFFLSKTSNPFIFDIKTIQQFSSLVHILCSLHSEFSVVDLLRTMLTTHNTQEFPSQTTLRSSLTAFIMSHSLICFKQNPEIQEFHKSNFAWQFNPFSVTKQRNKYIQHNQHTHYFAYRSQNHSYFPQVKIQNF